MARPRRYTDSGFLVPPLARENLFGRRTITGMEPYVTNAMMRRHASQEMTIAHRPRNGINDPVTFYHIIDALLQVQPGVLFRTVDLMKFLNEYKTQLSWDATTVGRVVTDIALSLHESYGRKPIDYVRRWNGMTYMVQEHPEFRVMVTRLWEDMAKVALEWVEAEGNGEQPQRLHSPLTSCPSMVV
jgi:hypothetical protein